MCDFPGGYFSPPTNTDNVTTFDAAYMDARDAEIRAIEEALGSDVVPGTGGNRTYKLSDRVRVSPGGNLVLAKSAESVGDVLIGTTTPGGRLHVQDDTTTDAQILLSNPNSTHGSGARSVLRLSNSTSSAALVYHDQYHTTSAHILRLVDNDTDPDADIRFYTAGSPGADRVTITQDGMVGIGTTSPLALLDVDSDTIRIRQVAKHRPDEWRQPW